MNKIIINGNDLSLEDLVKVSRQFEKVELSEEAKEKINTSRDIVDTFVDEEKVVYGITTGFGKFSDVMINKEESELLQRNLIISHACGVGNPLPEETSRAMMLLRINALCKGFSGIRLSTVETLVNMLNQKVHPVVFEKGSLGASGDLAPLSHMVLPMLGLGEAFFNGERMSGADAMAKAGVDVIALTSKEGLALINGTQCMTAVGALTVYDAVNLFKTADIVAGLTFEALNGITTALDNRVMTARPHQGQINSAINILKILEGSKRTTKQGELRVQDAYTLRCTPQVHGASKDALRYVIEKVEIEMNSATDNPLIFPDTNEAISSGNFHGQVMALAFDFLGIAVAEIANISERRLERLVNPALSNLPAFLTKRGGLHSGFMIVQYSAAALVSENKVLAHPSSVDSIPSSANQEDHVSMGTIGARKAKDILENTRKVLAMEMLAACQGIDVSETQNDLAKATKVAYDLLREVSATIDEDIVMYYQINNSENLIISNKIVEQVEQLIGEINI